MGVLVIVGTEKGGWLLRSEDRRDWRVDGPIFKGWKVTTSMRGSDGAFLVGTASQVYGPALNRSQDLESWQQIEKGPCYPEDGTRKLNQIWTLTGGNGTLYAGVDEAGLFRSSDQGESWEPVSSLNDHETRDSWSPGNGGLCAHVVLTDPASEDRIWCGISAVGVWRSDDGGASWAAKNKGVPVILEDQKHKDIGFCVHGLVPDPENPDRIYRQDHLGMFRTDDGGDSWHAIESGLPSGFGFPIVMDSRTKALFAFPLESDEYRIPVGGKFCVYRSDNSGESWQPLTRGLPQENAYMGVLRGAMATDSLDPCGVYVGSTSGTVHISSDRGDSWQTLPCTLPRVLSVRVFEE